MAPLKRFLALFCLLALSAIACSVTVDLGTQQLFGQANVPTMVAQTLQALAQAALSATPTSPPLPTATATPVNTPAPPTLSVSVATDCYAGPGSNYGFVITIRPGTTVTVVGKDTADNYWIIDTPGHPGTLCWLSGQYAKVSGDTGNLSSPATPAVSTYTLSEPRRLRASCRSASFSAPPVVAPGGPPGVSPFPAPPAPWWDDELHATVVIQWANTDPDQTGVRVYRNGWRIATLGRNATSYTDTFDHEWEDDVTYGVQAFNNTAVSSVVTIDVGHCK